MIGRPDFPTTLDPFLSARFWICFDRFRPTMDTLQMVHPHRFLSQTCPTRGGAMAWAGVATGGERGVPRFRVRCWSHGLIIVGGWMLAVWVGGATAARGQEELEVEAASQRTGYVVEVPLPLVGTRDSVVRRHIEQIADSLASDDRGPRPVVVLKFVPEPLATLSGAPMEEASSTRGTQFERALALARFLTSPITARVRPVAFVPQSVEGHAVLAVLACEAIYAAPAAEIGRAAIDEPADGTIEAAYRDIVQRRRTLPEAVALAMLDPRQQVHWVELADGSTATVRDEKLEALRNDGLVIRHEAVWTGGALAAFSGAQMRSRRWIDGTVDDLPQLATALGIDSPWRTVAGPPGPWRAVGVTIVGELTTSRVNQLLRAMEQHREQKDINLFVLWIDQATIKLSDGRRLAGYLAELDPEMAYTLAVVREPLTGPVCLIPASCRQCIMVEGCDFSADPQDRGQLLNESWQRSLDELATRTGRPLPLLSVLVDPDVLVQEYVHQDTGRRAIFADWQVQQQPDAGKWIPRQTIASGGHIDAVVAKRYGLIDGIEDRPELALSAFGLEAPPPEMSMPWLDATIQAILSQGWLPRLLLTIGFFALMAELGNPGLGAAGFLAALCFVGFFWLEALQGNVEMLEVLLFLGGLIALAIEIFVVPGFGIFGIGGLVMVFVSIVLASQTFIWPTTSEQLHEVAVNLFWVACLALGGMVGLLFMQKHMEQLPLLRWMVLQPQAGPDDPMAEKPGVRDHLLGQIGLTITRLNPSGKAQFGDDIVSVVGSGRLIKEGTPVRVVEVLGNLVIVEEADEADPQCSPPTGTN
ncbi:MAG: nodulation protein NfeD [Pirellulaceae bacterium]|nr:MAG: nodulation protein NfeD [Pirellulaceae bacterium]